MLCKVGTYNGAALGGSTDIGKVAAAGGNAILLSSSAIILAASMLF